MIWALFVLAERSPAVPEELTDRGIVCASPDERELGRRVDIVDAYGGEPVAVPLGHRLAEDSGGQPAGGEVGYGVRGAGLQRDHGLDAPRRAGPIEHGAQARAQR